MKNNIAQLLTYRANMFPHIEAAVDAHCRLTYQELNQQVNQVVHWLQQKGVKKGDRIALLCQNSVSMLSILLATAKVGAVSLPLNCRLNMEELLRIMKDSAPTILFYDSAWADQLNLIRKTNEIHHFIQIGDEATEDTYFSHILRDQPTLEPEIEAGGDDLCVLVYTSGTTGKPKGVMLSHHNLWMAAHHIGNHFDWRTFDRNLIMTPFFHISGWMFTMTNLLRGSTAIYATFQPEFIWHLIEKERITQAFAVPTMIHLMMNVSDWMERKIDSLRFLICGADTVPVSLIQECNSFGIEICHGYGFTEGSGTIASWVGGMRPDKKHTCGKPTPFTEIKIVDPLTKEELPLGQVGEIVFKGPQIFLGYWKKPEETKQVLRNGWYYSGDLGKFDADGYLIIVDRYKDMIISSGENIYPAEIEAILLQLDGIKEVAVVGAPDKLKGQVPLAFVVKRPHSTLSKNDIIDFCNGQLASFKCGQDIEFIEELPRNANGKVLKKQLRELAQTLIDAKGDND